MKRADKDTGETFGRRHCAPGGLSKERRHSPGGAISNAGYIFPLLMLVAVAAHAQQYSPRTHFYENKLAYNPATAGVENEIPIRLNYRQQWTGLEDAPYSQTLSSQAFAGKSIGLGLVMYNDVAGPSRNTGLQASVSRHFGLDQDGKRWFSFGMSMLLYEYKFDTRRLQTDTPNDPAVNALARQNSRLVPDVAAGVYVNDANGFVGISCMNLIETKSDILSTPDNRNTIERGYYLFAGYRFPLSDLFSIEPVALVKMTETGAWQADMMVKANYDRYWAGLDYRTDDAIAALFGLRVDMFSFSYSYDYPVSEIGSFNKGTHEVTAAVYIFNATSRGGTREKSRGDAGGRSFNPVPRRR